MAKHTVKSEKATPKKPSLVKLEPKAEPTPLDPTVTTSHPDKVPVRIQSEV